MRNLEQTIAALSTPPGESGIAVVRISGPEALNILSSIFSSPSMKTPAPGQWEHRRLYHGTIAGRGGEVIDEVLCAVMRKPDSYTGEDVVEISSHGSIIIVNQILELVCSKGARIAEPGEFTKRAFLNGKIDLIQAEAVCDLIHARSELQRKVAQEQLAGTLSQKINKLADDMVSMLADVEVGIDFIEEEIEVFNGEKAKGKLKEHISELDKLLSAADLNRPFREGYRVSLTGPVNAGKSSIFNCISGRKRAIVTEIPGTTRDVIREPLIIDGVLFVFQDTAGLRRRSGDKIEAIGINMAKDAVEESDIVLFVLDMSARLPEDEVKQIESLDRNNSIVVLNKKDLPSAFSKAKFKELFPDLRCVETSAITGEGLEQLKGELIDSAGKELINRIASERIMLNARLISLMRSAREACIHLLDLLAKKEPLEILAVAIRDVLYNYEEATGKRYTEDLLDNVFSRFCIGK